MTARSLILHPSMFSILGVHLSHYERLQFIRRLSQSGMGSEVIAVPWDLMMQHEDQCLRNHSQTVQRLHERGGLSVDEAVAVLEDREWMAMDAVEANRRLLEIVNTYLQENGHEDA